MVDDPEFTIRGDGEILRLVAGRELADLCEGGGVETGDRVGIGVDRPEVGPCGIKRERSAAGRRAGGERAVDDVGEADAGGRRELPGKKQRVEVRSAGAGIANELHRVRTGREGSGGRALQGPDGPGGGGGEGQRFRRAAIDHEIQWSVAGAAVGIAERERQRGGLGESEGPADHNAGALGLVVRIAGAGEAGVGGLRQDVADEFRVFVFGGIEEGKVEAVDVSALRAVGGAQDDGAGAGGQEEGCGRVLIEISGPGTGRREGQRDRGAVVDHEMKRPGGGAAVGVAEPELDVGRLGEGDVPCHGDGAALAAGKVREAAAGEAGIGAAGDHAAGERGAFRLEAEGQRRGGRDIEPHRVAAGSGVGVADG